VPRHRADPGKPTKPGTTRWWKERVASLDCEIAAARQSADREAAALRARIAELETREKESCFQVHVVAHYFSGLTWEQANAKLKALIDCGSAKFVRLVEDP
jgi:hypothetical protein